jgi:hypothetical protein
VIQETKVRPATTDPKEVVGLREHTENREKQAPRYVHCMCACQIHTLSVRIIIRYACMLLGGDASIIL